LSTNELFAADLIDDEMQAGRNRDAFSTGKETCEGRAQAGSDEALSNWSRSSAKRFFDVVCVVASLPVVLPLLFLVGLAVRCTSRGPVLFRQDRMGMAGRTFRIMKFRTMVYRRAVTGSFVTTSSDRRFTPIGPFLRRWKLDELPQLLHVLSGRMSLVGPRPKVPEHEPEGLCCRPGVTGAATLAFAREEQALDRVPRELLDEYYCSVVLPVKRQLDAEYMCRATFWSDLALVCNSLLGQWDSRRMRAALDARHAQFSELQPQPNEAVRQPLRRVPVAMRVMEVSSVEGDSL